MTASSAAPLVSLRRAAIFDPIPASRFWLYDVAPIDGLSLPLFSPLAGFTSISAPEISAETMDITEGNAMYPTKVIKGASVGSITLSRGVTFYNSDFFNWMKAAVSGTTANLTNFSSTGIGGVGGVTYRRSLLLVHFFRNFGLGTPTADDETRRASAAAAAAATGAAVSAATGVLLGAGQSLQAGVAGGSSALLQYGALWGAREFNNSPVLVPARAFLLHKCVPVRYRSGSDFDASTGDISIQELEVDAEMVEEISLSSV